MSWGANISEALQQEDSNIFAQLTVMVFASYRHNFSSLLPYSMVIAGLICLGYLLLGNIWLLLCLVFANFYLQSIILQLKPNWQLCGLASLPYILVAIILNKCLGVVGSVIGMFWLLSTAYFKHGVLNNKNILDAYLDSIFLTWGYNIRFLLFLLIPFILLLSMKLLLLNLSGLNNYELLIYWPIIVLMLPWFAFSYAIFYEYLKIEQKC